MVMLAKFEQTIVKMILKKLISIDITGLLRPVRKDAMYKKKHFIFIMLLFCSSIRSTEYASISACFATSHLSHGLCFYDKALYFAPGISSTAVATPKPFNNLQRIKLYTF